MLWQHASKPRLQAIVAAFAAGAQHSENLIFAVIVGATTVGGAEGASLDRWGEVVGEFRGGLADDEDYRRFIALRVRVNTEHPSTDAMWEILFGRADPPERGAVYPSIPGSPFASGSFLVADGIIYQVESVDFLDDSVAAHAGALIRDFRPAGIYAAVVEYPYEHFAFSWEASDPTKPTPQPFGSIADPGTAVLARLIYNGRSR
jgi:hypothetical protein